MENLNYTQSNNNKDAVLYENAKVFVTKSNSFEILNEVRENSYNTNDTKENFVNNQANIKITSR
jgi:hypothetical protein